jgi:hypothetical protein
MWCWACSLLAKADKPIMRQQQGERCTTAAKNETTCGIGGALGLSFSERVQQEHCVCNSVAANDCAACRKPATGGQLRRGHGFGQLPVHCAAQPHTKLTVNPPGDFHEREADLIADQIMGSTPGQFGQIRRRTNPSALVQRASAAEANTAPPDVDEVMRSPGRPLDAETRAFMEPRCGRDLSLVQVHSDAAAEQSARNLRASAYTVGHHIVFGRGRFTPRTPQGQRLIAHELAHVLQQTAGYAGVQRQGVIPMEPWVRPMPVPRVGPLPRVGPVPEIGPLPYVGPMPGTIDFEPEMEVEETPQEEELVEPEGSSAREPDMEPQPKLSPQPAPWPAPPTGPQPEQKRDDNQCGSKRMPLTRVTWSTGSLGQGGTVRASPLTRCPGNTIGSPAKPSTYPDQFRCIKKAGLSRTWLPLHLLHGATRRTGSRNLHGPGNERWNIVIGDPALNGSMYKSVEDFVINRVYDWNQVLWLESKVVEYFPGADFFAKKMSLAWGLYDTNTNSEVTTIGGGTFESTSTPPACAPSSPAGAKAIAPGAASGFDTTLGMCKELKSQRNFKVDTGGLELTLRSRNQSAACPVRDYLVELWKYNGRIWPDGDFGSKTVPAGKTVRLRWRNLPQGEYYFVFKVGNRDPGCCVQANMSVRFFHAMAGAASAASHPVLAQSGQMAVG